MSPARVAGPVTLEHDAQDAITWPKGLSRFAMTNAYKIDWNKETEVVTYSALKVHFSLLQSKKKKKEKNEFQKVSFADLMADFLWHPECGQDFQSVHQRVVSDGESSL